MKKEVSKIEFTKEQSVEFELTNDELMSSSLLAKKIRMYYWDALELFKKMHKEKKLERVEVGRIVYWKLNKQKDKGK